MVEVATPGSILTPQNINLHNRLQTDYRFFAKIAQKIKAKDGDVRNFEFNRAQNYLHRKVNEDLQLKGFVRIVIVKGRQQGMSTYVSGRFYWISTRRRGQSVFILSHEADTTKKLFRMVKRFHDNCPESLKPHADTDSRKELIFDKLESDYTVGTAGNENVGRGGTQQEFHGSEVAFWPKTDGIVSGVMQSIPRAPLTEIFLESTGNGPKGFFYDTTMDALKGLNDYTVVFIPWFWQQEYRAIPPPDFERTEEEQELSELFGLDIEQLFWRRIKISDLKSITLFKREYPNTIMEAFLSSGDSLVDPNRMDMARKRTVKVDPNDPIILGVDPARVRDKTALVWRQGRVVLRYKLYDKMDDMKLAAILIREIDRKKADMIFIDYAIGYGTYSRMKELGYGTKIKTVHFGSASIDPKIYKNKRTEMGMSIKEFFEEDVSVPDDDTFAADVLMVPGEDQNSSGVLILMSKDKIRDEYKRSSDIFDGLGLTFAYPVKSDRVQHMARQRRVQKINSSSLRAAGGPLTTRRRIR